MPWEQASPLRVVRCEGSARTESVVFTLVFPLSSSVPGTMVNIE